MRLRHLLFAIACLSCTLAGCWRPSQNSDPNTGGGGDEVQSGEFAFEKFTWTATEKPAADVGDGSIVPSSLRVSPDGRRYACAVQRADHQAWVVDGQEVGQVGNIAAFVFSGDSKHYLCMGTKPGWDERILLYDGKPVPDTGPHTRNIWLSFDGSERAWLTTDNLARNHLFINGKEVLVGGQQNLPAEFWPHLQVLSSGPKIHWMVATYNATVIDGEPSKHGIARDKEVVFSHDGMTQAYVVSKDGEEFVVLNGKPQKRYASIPTISLVHGVGYDFAPIRSTFFVFSRDGKHWGHPTGDPGIVVDGKKFPTELPPLWPIAFNSDGSHWACFCVEPGGIHDTKGHVVVDGKLGKSYTTVGEVFPGQSDPRWTKAKQGRGLITFSPDGQHVAYAAGLRIEDEKAKDYRTLYQFIVRDEAEEQRFGWVSPSPVFSPDSKHLAYWAADKLGGSPVLVVDNTQVAGPFQKYLQIIGQERDVDQAGFPMLEFSPDSRSVGTVVRQDDEWMALLDGQPRQAYDRVAPENTRAGFTPEGKFTYLAERGGVLYWVEEQRK